jgi:glycerol-3-phosphate cytidylyltransferase
VTIVYTGGTFDMFHAGHVNFLKQCRRIADGGAARDYYGSRGDNPAHEDGQVIVSLNTDRFVETYKGKAPVISYADRKSVLEGCKYVDKVVENSKGADSKPAILLVKPDFIVIDTGWAFEDYYAQMSFTQDWLDTQDIGLIYVPRKQGISTTEIRANVK